MNLLCINARCVFNSKKLKNYDKACSNGYSFRKYVHFLQFEIPASTPAFVVNLGSSYALSMKIAMKYVLKLHNFLVYRQIYKVSSLLLSISEDGSIELSGIHLNLPKASFTFQELL